MNKDYALYKKEAIKLRKRGLSYNEIKKQIPVAKSSLSLWLKNISLKPEQRERLYTKQIEILSRGPQSQRERRKREIEKIIEEAGSEIQLPISDEAYKLFGVALYWAEGNKTKSFEITNSDPYLVAFMVKWFKEMFGVKIKTLKSRLNIYPQQNDIKIKKFWSQLTGIPLKNFGKTYVKPLSSGYKKNNLYYGTIKIYVPRGTNMRHKVFGWLKSVLNDVDTKVKITERKWLSLTKGGRAINIKHPPIA